MSQSRKIARNLERLNLSHLSKSEVNILGGLSRNGITVQDMARELNKVRLETHEATALAVHKVMYAMIALTLVEEFGFSKEECFNALLSVDHRLLTAIDNEEVIKEMEEKTGIRFNSDNGVERIQLL